MPHYPWIFITILTVWVCLTFILAGASDRIDVTFVFLLGAVFTTIIAVKGLRPDV
ncbi:MAG: hypothetical protein Q7S01_02860 [bacterium]|nr:hypothetical protein [bacterium]